MSEAVAGWGGIDACVFDAYGTLFDVHGAVARYGQGLGAKAAALSATWRQKQPEYTWLRSLMGAHRDFWAITGDSLDVAMAQHGIDDAALRAKLLAAYLTLDAYPEVPEALTRLRRSGRWLAILSNGTPPMLDAAVQHAGLADLFDAVLSVETVGIFKPSAEVYHLVTAELNVPKERIAFVSSNGWDVHGAAHFGFRTVWLNRFGLPEERLPGTPRAVIDRLDGLLPLLGAG